MLHLVDCSKNAHGVMGIFCAVIFLKEVTLPLKTAIRMSFPDVSGSDGLFSLLWCCRKVSILAEA